MWNKIRDLLGNFDIMATASDQFYQNLPLLTSFTEVLRKENHHPLPDDWWVALTDVVNSTGAIEAGRYKDVNTAGGLAAMALSNVNQGMDFPFIFGGDGVTCLIPPQMVDLAHDVLFDTQQKVKTFFELDLRIALIPVRDLYAEDHLLEIAKLRVSPHYNQAIISGDGLAFADHLMKTAAERSSYLIVDKKTNIEADFTGFTCRWQDIPSNKEETISTIIHFRDAENEALLQDIMEQLYHIFGKEDQFHPISQAHLQLARSEDYLGAEATVSSGQKKGWKYWWQLQRIKMESLVTRLAMQLALQVKVGHYDLHRVKDYQVAASDFKKFDGSLKMVLNCQTKDRQRWEHFLEQHRQAGKLFYGIHVADRALMTCLLHSGSEKEVHFIDAADGGYALAAKQLKEQMNAPV
ncbi:MAG: DUF3095 domain-containing protein [Bacteroidota bacterium]